jgi:hypothetical protein
MDRNAPGLLSLLAIVAAGCSGPQPFREVAPREFRLDPPRQLSLVRKVASIEHRPAARRFCALDGEVLTSPSWEVLETTGPLVAGKRAVTIGVRLLERRPDRLQDEGFVRSLAGVVTPGPIERVLVSVRSISFMEALDLQGYESVQRLASREPLARFELGRDPERVLDRPLWTGEVALDPSAFEWWGGLGAPEGGRLACALMSILVVSNEGTIADYDVEVHAVRRASPE